MKKKTSDLAIASSPVPCLLAGLEGGTQAELKSSLRVRKVNPDESYARSRIAAYCHSGCCPSTKQTESNKCLTAGENRAGQDKLRLNVPW